MFVYGVQLSENEAFCQPGDNIIEISLVDNSQHEYHFCFAFDEEGVNRAVIIEKGFVYG